MRDFNRFINSVLENKLLRSNELVEQFLTKNPDEFHVIKLKYNNLSKIVSLNDFHTLTGELDLTFYNDKLHSFSNILQNIEKKRDILKEINKTLENISICIDNLNKYEDTLSKLFFKLEKEYQYKDNNFISLENLGNFFKNISNFYSEKKICLDTKIKEFFNYINMELKELKNLCNDSKYAKINLEKCNIALNNFQNDKGKNIKNKQMFNYELQKQQFEKQVAQRTCNFLSNRTFEEFERIINFHSLRFKKYFSLLGPNISELLKNEYNNSIGIINYFNS